MTCHSKSYMSLHVITCHYMSLHVTTYHYMSLHVTTCHYMSLHVTTCHYMSLHVTTCQYTSNVITLVMLLHAITPVMSAPVIEAMWAKLVEGMWTIGLYHPLDGLTNPQQKLLHFLTITFYYKEKKALAFDWVKCCYLALCLQLFSSNGFQPVCSPNWLFGQMM